MVAKLLLRLKVKQNINMELNLFYLLFFTLFELFYWITVIFFNIVQVCLLFYPSRASKHIPMRPGLDDVWTDKDFYSLISLSVAF